MSLLQSSFMKMKIFFPSLNMPYSLLSHLLPPTFPIPFPPSLPRLLIYPIVPVLSLSRDFTLLHLLQAQGIARVPKQIKCLLVLILKMSGLLLTWPCLRLVTLWRAGTIFTDNTGWGRLPLSLPSKASASLDGPAFQPQPPTTTITTVSPHHPHTIARFSIATVDNNNNNFIPFLLYYKHPGNSAF